MEVVQFEEETMKISRYASIIFAAVVIVLVCGGNWIAAKGPPVANFPNFIPLTINKTGDVAIDKVGNVYVNVTATNGHVQIWKYSPAGEGPDVVADLGEGTAYGLALDANGDIYAINDGADMGYKGIYRVDHQGGDPVLLPGTEQIVFPNALAFDQLGNLYVTESVSSDGKGGIWRIPKHGEEAEPWLRDPLLTGIGGVLAAFPFGANGIAFYHGDLYVANSDKHLIVRIPVHPDGSPGQADIWKDLEEVPESLLLLRQKLPVWAPDGIALDVHGNLYVTMVTRAAVVRINAEDHSQETIAVLGPDLNAPLFAPLDAPNTIAFGTGKGGRQSLFVTNASFGPPFPGRGLVKIEAEEPGQPLP